MRWEDEDGWGPGSLWLINSGWGGELVEAGAFDAACCLQSGGNLVVILLIILCGCGANALDNFRTRQSYTATTVTHQLHSSWHYSIVLVHVLPQQCLHLPSPQKIGLSCQILLLERTNSPLATIP